MSEVIFCLQLKNRKLIKRSLTYVRNDEAIDGKDETDSVYGDAEPHEALIAEAGGHEALANTKFLSAPTLGADSNQCRRSHQEVTKEAHDINDETQATYETTQD